MRKVNVWVLTGSVMVAVIGTALLISPAPSVQAKPEVVVVKDHWRNHDGHWSYWSEADKHWYYTDGVHWFINEGPGWALYRFDKKFGREGFVRGEYKVPDREVKIVVPHHGIYHP